MFTSTCTWRIVMSRLIVMSELTLESFGIGTLPDDENVLTFRRVNVV